MPADRRIRRTQRLLQQALVDLVLEKGYRHLTIQDVVDRADIGYRTFFRHYEGLDDLLADVTQRVIDDLDARLNFYEPLVGDQVLVSAREKGRLLFVYVREHETIFRVLLLDDGVRFVLQPFMRRMRRKIAEVLENLPGSTHLPPLAVANHLLVATLALMRWWLEVDLGYDETHMGQIFADLIVAPAWHVME